MFYAALLAIVAPAVLASPIERQAKSVVLPLTQVSSVTSIKNIVNKGQDRIKEINGATPQVSSGSVTNEDVSYVAPVSIGGKTFSLIVDTGCTSLLQTSQGPFKALY